MVHELLKLGNTPSVVTWAIVQVWLFGQNYYLSSVSDTSMLFFLGIYVSLFHLFFFPSDTQVVMVSIGNTYHYSWNIYGQSTVGRIFLDSIVNRSYSVFFLLLIILFSFISFSYFDGEEVGL